MYSFDQDYLQISAYKSALLPCHFKANTSNIIIKMYENNLVDFLKAQNVKDSSLSSWKAALGSEVKLRTGFWGEARKRCPVDS